MPKCRGGIVALVFHTLAGDAEDRHLLRLSVRIEHFRRPRRRLQTDLPTIAQHEDVHLRPTVEAHDLLQFLEAIDGLAIDPDDEIARSAEHTSELQSLMRISYAVLCLKNRHNVKTTLTTSSL